MDRCSRRKRKKAWNLELGSFEVGDGGNGVIKIEEHEKQIPAKGGRTHRGRPFEARILMEKRVQIGMQMQVISSLHPPCVTSV